MIHIKMSSKTVIFVWTQRCCNIKTSNRENFFGIGDMIRGMIATYEICLKLQYTFHIDLQLHPLSQFLENPHHPHHSYIEQQKDHVWFVPREQNLEAFLTNHSQKVISIMTNAHYHSIDSAIQTKICDLFENQKPEFRIYYTNIVKHLSLDQIPYEIIHFRLGDHFMVCNEMSPVSFDSLKKTFERYHKEKQLILSDSKPWKDYLKLHYKDTVMFDMSQIGHFGYHQDYELIRDTLVEFLLVLNCNQIYTYSVYPWKSGFVTIPSVLKNINIETIH